MAEGQRGQGDRGNFSNLVSQPYAFEVLKLTEEIFHFQLGLVGVFTGTLLGAKGEREQVYLLFTLSLTETEMNQMM